MDFNNFIGYPLSYVEKILKENNVNYQVEEIQSKKEKYDNFLIVNIKYIGDKVNIYVDKFLLNI